MEKPSPTCPSCGTPLPEGAAFCHVCGVPSPTTPVGLDETSRPVDTTAEELVALEDGLRAALHPSYLLIRRLGTGGMGSVFLAREPALKRLVAVKVLAPTLAVDESARTRFEREAQAVARLAHPNVVAIHGLGELDDGTPYFVMQPSK